MLDTNFKVQNAIDWETFLEKLDDDMYDLYCDIENKDRLLCFGCADIGRSGTLDDLLGGSWEYIANSHDNYINDLHKHFKAKSSTDLSKPDRSKFWLGWEWPMDLRSPSDIIEEAAREWEAATNGELTIGWVYQDSAFVLSVETFDGERSEKLGLISGPRYSYPQTISKVFCQSPLELEKALMVVLGKDSVKDVVRSLMMRPKHESESN